MVTPLSPLRLRGSRKIYSYLATKAVYLHFGRGFYRVNGDQVLIGGATCELTSANILRELCDFFGVLNDRRSESQLSLLSRLIMLANRWNIGINLSNPGKNQQ